MSLYTTYRPHDWDSVIGQDYITTILRNSLRTDRVNHAYLFHGSRGTGKTTSARILAEGVNCTDLQDGNPCHTCENCRAFDSGTMLDCIEIDGASNNGIENVRDLIEKARFEPNQGKYKVYIIDEVHMLSTGAFNALLKTLEEPPNHVKFILATTEIEKVPETIRSRTLRFDFRKITNADIITRLEFVCKEEKISAEKEALELIARVARGGLRDALTLLEQNTIEGEVRLDHVRYTLALVEDTLIDDIIESLRKSESTKILDILEKFRTGHIDARGLFEQLLYRLRDLMFEYISDPRFHEYQEIFTLIMEGHARIKLIPDGMMLIEVTLLKIVKRRSYTLTNPQGNTSVSENKKTRKNGESEGATLSERRGKQGSDERQQSESEFIDPSGAFGTFQSGKVQKDYETLDSGTSQEGQKSGEPRTQNLEPAIQPSNLPANPLPNQPTTQLFSFPLLINHFREGNPALMADIKSARFQVEGTVLTLIFQKSWNHTRVNTPKIKNLIIESLGGLFTGTWTIECRLEENTGSALNVDEVF